MTYVRVRMRHDDVRVRMRVCMTYVRVRMRHDDVRVRMRQNYEVCLILRHDVRVN